MEARIASARLEAFLRLNEVDEQHDDSHDKQSDIRVTDATWTWYATTATEATQPGTTSSSTSSLTTSLLTAQPSHPSIALHSINLHIPHGSLVAIIGAVGSGKSCLLQALAGELHLLSGTVSVTSNCAYTPQQAYLCNATLRDNICFAHAYDATRYARVAEMCGLRADVETMPGKDECEIGEKVSAMIQHA